MGAIMGSVFSFFSLQLGHQEEVQVITIHCRISLPIPSSRHITTLTTAAAHAMFVDDKSKSKACLHMTQSMTIRSAERPQILICHEELQRTSCRTVGSIRGTNSTPVEEMGLADLLSIPSNPAVLFYGGRAPVSRSEVVFGVHTGDYPRCPDCKQLCITVMCSESWTICLPHGSVSAYA
jgi:hypothetical protein